MKKNIYRKIFSLILVSALLFGAASITVFAGGGDGSSDPEVDRTNTTKSWSQNFWTTTGAFPSQMQSLNISGYDQLGFAITLGIVNKAHIDQIVIRYYTSADSAYPYTQFIDVNKGASDAISSFVKENSMSYFRNNVSGSTKFDYSKYEDAAKYLVPNVNTETFPSPAHKVADSNGKPPTQQSHSVVYVNAIADYKVFNIESVSFLCSTDGADVISGELEILDWSVGIRTDYDIFQYGSNFAFVSNQFGMNFAYGNRYGCTEKTSAKIEDGIAAAPNTLLTFHNKTYLPAYGFDSSKEDYNGGSIYLDSAYVDKYVKTSHIFSDMSETEYLGGFNTKYWEDLLCEYTNVPGVGYKYRMNADMFRSDIMGGGDMQLLCCEEKGTKDGSSPTTVNFEIKLADEYMAGIEKFNVAASNPTAGNPLNLSDDLTVKIVYRNADNMRSTVVLPVISNSLLSAVVSTEEKELKSGNYDSQFVNSSIVQAIKSGKYVEYAQQGTTMVFGVTFPSFKTIESLKLSYKDPSAQNDAQIGIESIAAYSNYETANWKITGTATRDHYAKDFANGRIDVSANVDNTELMFVSTNERVMWVINGDSDFDIPMKDVRNLPASQKAVPHPESDFENKYLVTFTTDTMAAAATSGDVIVQFTYKDFYDNEKETAEYNIREICNNYEGYVDGVVNVNNLTHSPENLAAGTQRDMAYYYGMNSGNSIHFILTIRNLMEFTGAKFKLENSADEWQMGSMSIVQLTDLSERYINSFDKPLQFTSSSDEGTLTFTMNRSYARIAQGLEVYKSDKPILVTKGDGTSTDFESGDVAGGQEELRPDMEDYEHEQRLPQYMAESDLKFTTAVQSYDVVVHVGKNSQYAAGDDGCGSNNMYYFQLQFADGATSAYVLANKQLSADGFRSGANETFVITSNKDHGNVTGIKIIPDDISSNADPLDKLCIDSIDVIKRNTNIPDKKFVAENIGWISSAYRDTSEQNDKKTRTEYEMALSFPISYSAYMMNIEIDLVLGAYAAGVEQFVGDMTCDIYYETSSGEADSYTDIQVVEALYAYKNRTAQLGTATNNLNYVSDSKTMFRDNHTDRFIVSVEDCSKITKIVLHGKPLQSTKMNIKAINIYALRSKGTLVLSDLDGDYTRTYNKGLEPVLVAELESQAQRSCSFVAGQNNSVSFYLESSEFPDFDEEKPIDSSIARVPQSSQDTINMYLYLDPDTPIPSNAKGAANKGTYKLDAGFVYSTVDGTSSIQMSTTDLTYKKIDGYNVLYKEGMTASNMNVLTYVWASCQDDITSTYKIDHAVIQQVRNGVVIDTMYAPMGGIFTKKGGTTSKSIGSAKQDKTSQVVTLQLAPGTEAGTLTPGVDDIAVSLMYRTNSIGSERNSFTSPVVFATDDGTRSIREGSILTFNFNEYDVKEIVGIRVQATGDVVASIGGVDNGGATIECTEVVKPADTSRDTKEVIETSRYSSTAGSVIKLSSRTPAMSVVKAEDPTALTRLDIGFDMKTENTIIDSAGKAPIRLIVEYRTYGFSNTKTVVIEDIRKYIRNDNASFGDGGRVDTTLFLPGFESIMSIQIEPYDEDDSYKATWNLKYMRFKIYDGEDTDEHIVRVDYSKQVDAYKKPIEYICEGSPMKFILYGENSVELFDINNLTDAEKKAAEEAAKAAEEAEKARQEELNKRLEAAAKAAEEARQAALEAGKTSEEAQRAAEEAKRAAEEQVVQDLATSLSNALKAAIEEYNALSLELTQHQAELEGVNTSLQQLKDSGQEIDKATQQRADEVIADLNAKIAAEETRLASLKATVDNLQKEINALVENH